MEDIPLDDRLRKLVSELLQKNSITGNLEIIEKTFNVVNALMQYNQLDQTNPAEGFSQYLLFEGPPGNLKSVPAVYAMAVAKELAERSQKSVSFAKLDFKDAYEHGPIVALRYNLKQISEGNQINILFLEDIESKFPSQKALYKPWHPEVISEFIQFIYGVKYNNKGNFIMLATAQNLENIDPAIAIAFTRYKVDGLVTAK